MTVLKEGPGRPTMPTVDQEEELLLQQQEELLKQQAEAEKAAALAKEAAAQQVWCPRLSLQTFADVADAQNVKPTKPQTVKPAAAVVEVCEHLSPL